MNLIHIGMPKAGSTSLQNFWSQTKDINLVWRELDVFVNSVRNAVRRQDDPNKLLALWPEAEKSNIQSRVNIFSSEGLFGLPLAHRFTKEQVDYSRYLYANISREFIPEAKVLILTRNPFAWIRSTYIQSIQEGRNWGFIRFLNLEMEALLESFNLSSLVMHWAETFGRENVILYPVEKLFRDPRSANDELVSALSFPELNIFSSEQHANKSISVRQAYILRGLSVLNASISQYDKSLGISFEKLNKDMRLLYRVAMQKGKRTPYNSAIRVPDCLPAIPPVVRERLKSQLERCFLPALAESGDYFNMFDYYVNDIEQHFGCNRSF